MIMFRLLSKADSLASGESGMAVGFTQEKRSLIKCKTGLAPDESSEITSRATPVDTDEISVMGKSKMSLSGSCLILRL
jgi:hypothetical protein